MSDRLTEIIRQATRPLEPVPTGVPPRLPPLAGIRAVLFDIYGTLLISGSGEVGSADEARHDKAFADALRAAGITVPAAGVALLHEQIEASHRRSRRAGIDYPEVDIVAIWHAVCRQIDAGPPADARPTPVDLQRLAVEFEIRANPVWPMPGMEGCLEELRKQGQILGIISNAQFFSPLALAAATGKSLEAHGFDPLLQYYSYEHGRAKPGLWLYELAARELSGRGIRPEEVLYVGNDMRNDVWPAATVGFRTALFAGDRRSLRMRQDQAASSQRPADAVATELSQIPPLVGP